YNPNGHSFVLHSAHFNIDHKFSDSLTAHIGIDAGRDATINGARPYGGGPFDVLEAFATYTGGKVSLTAGKFVTYEGIEVAPGPLNPTVTRGYLYYFAEPITHTGFKVHYQATDELNIGLGIVNGWDNLVDDNNMKTFIGRIGYTPSTSFFAALSATYGAEALHNDKNQRLSLDLTGCWTVTDTLLLNFQGNFGTEPNAGYKNQSSTAIDSTASWYGVGVQPVYTSGAWSLAGRLEWFADPNGARVAAAAAGAKGNYVNVTLAPGYKLADGFRIRAELRADISTEKTIPLVARGAGTTMFTGALMADYQF
ncbi:MAG TPA: outer membrane beta-barrel protein, partial [Polyangiales bacterium]